MSRRVRGYAPWRPQARTMVLLGQIDSVLAEYRSQWPLTIRQCFYRLVAVYAYPKTDDAYERLGEHLNRARRMGHVPWEALRDDGAVSHEPTVFPAWREFLARQTHPSLADLWIPDMWVGQPRRVEVWSESAGMVPMLAREVADHRVPVRSGGGFSSVTALRTAALTIAEREVPTVVLHVGDHDPSGVHVFSSAMEDVSAFVAAHGGRVEFARVAVLPEHVTAYGLPTAPPKATDRRKFTGETVQAEALRPDVLARLVEGAVQALVDAGAWIDRVAEVASDREALREALLVASDGGAAT